MIEAVFAQFLFVVAVIVTCCVVIAATLSLFFAPSGTGPR